MKVICIIGLPGSGKSEALKVAGEMGLPTFNMGDVITKIEPARRGIGKITEDIEFGIRTSIREERGPAAVAIITAEELEKKGSDTIVIGGVHTFAEMEYFRERYGEDFYMIAIEVPFETRAERTSIRKERPMDEEILRKREERYRKQFDVHEMVKQADFVVPNDGALEDLRSAVRELLEKLK